MSDQTIRGMKAPSPAVQHIPPSGIEQWGGIDPGSTRHWGAFIMAKTDGSFDLLAGRLEFHTDALKPYFTVAGKPLALVNTFIMLEYPGFRPGMEGFEMRNLQETIRQATLIETYCQQLQIEVKRMVPQSILASVTNYYRDLARFNAWLRKMKRAKRKGEFPTRDGYIKSFLEQLGFECGRGTILSTADPRDALITCLAGMKYKGSEKLMQRRLMA